jgi:tripartite-type tricarboxylate transporter receptor subunit TctC
MVAVPYRGSVAAFTDVVGGRLDAMLDTATSAIPRIRNGQLRPLAMSSPERYPLMPETPTMAETVPDIKQWLADTGVLAAPSSPEELQRRVETEIELYSRIAEANGIKAE